MYFILFVLDNSSLLDPILDAWYEIGIKGVTILESTGIQRRRALKRRIPMRFPLAQASVEATDGNLTLFTIVENQTMVNKCLEITEKIVGNLDNPNTGVLTAWPVTITKGIQTAGRGE